METKIVDRFPSCSECVSTDRTPPNDATFSVVTPMKLKMNLCDEHFFEYVTNRLGKNTVVQLALVQKSGSRKAA